jgi:hypothetical protein
MAKLEDLLATPAAQIYGCPWLAQLRAVRAGKPFEADWHQLPKECRPAGPGGRFRVSSTGRVTRISGKPMARARKP